jgi:dienelactone hydrolase
MIGKFSVSLLLFLTLAAVPSATAQSASTSPLTAQMDAIAQQQLRARATTIAAIRDTTASEERKREVRRKVLHLLGGLPEYRGPLNPKVTRVIQRDGYSIENVIFESLPNFFVTANLYRPLREGKHPAVLMSMGHWDGGKVAAQWLCANLARKGFVVLAYDPVGQGERQQAYDPRLGRSLIGGSTSQHFLNGAAAILMGQNVARYFIHDGMRAIDYLVSRPEVDAQRIGATGCSGGGTQTTYIAALDERVKVAAPACYMNSFQTLFSGAVGDSEQSLPGFLAAGLDQTDYVELFAPKPWLIASTEEDFFTPAGARQVFEEAQRWYDLYGARDRIQWVVGSGGHGTPLKVREAIYDWMIRWLLNGKGDPREERVELVPDHELWVTSKGQVEGRELYQIIAETPRQPGTQSELRSWLNTLSSQNPPLLQDPEITVTTTASGASQGKSPAVILVGAPSQLTPLVRALAEQGNVVIVVKPVAGGDDSARPRVGNWLPSTRSWLIGRNLVAMEAAQIRAAVDAAVKRPDVDPSRISARALGIAGIWLLLAAAQDERISAITLEQTPHSFRAAIDAPLHANLHDAVLPGFALRFDLQDLRGLMGSRKVVWSNPTDWNGNVVPLAGDYRYRSSDSNQPLP